MSHIVFFLRKPSADVIAHFLASQAELQFSYAEVGATRSQPPAGYVVDHTRVKLGEGDAVFSAARAALERWQQFQLGWVEAAPGNTPIEVAVQVAVCAFVWGAWTLQAARIVYVVHDHLHAAGGPRRFGFAYGTLPGHMEMGEERFLIEQLADGSVWYDVLAFSRPRHILARLGYPMVRRLQKRFGRASAAAMQAACHSPVVGTAG